MIHHRMNRNHRRTLDVEASFRSRVEPGEAEGAVMASIAIAAIAGCMAGGGVTGMVTWLTGGDHDTYGKGAKVLYIEPTYYISLDNLDDPKVYKDESSSFIHLPKMQWTTELIIAAVCIGLGVHFLGGLWGWMGGKKHGKEMAEKEHAVNIAELKADHAREMGSYVAEHSRHREQIKALQEQMQAIRQEANKKVSALSDRHEEEMQKQAAETKVAHAALAKLVHEAPSDDDEDDDDDESRTLDRISRRDNQGAQGGATARATSVPASTRKKKKKIPVEEYLKRN